MSVTSFWSEFYILTKGTNFPDDPIVILKWSGISLRNKLNKKVTPFKITFLYWFLGEKNIAINDIRYQSKANKMNRWTKKKINLI